MRPYPENRQYNWDAVCAYPGCTVQIVSNRSKSGLCAYHKTRQWKKNNTDAVNADNRRYRAENPDKANAWRKKWLDAHPDYKADAEQLRRSRKAAALKEKVYRSVVFRRDGGLCGICGTAVDPAAWHLDHIIPLSRGGEHSYGNTQVSHPDCNVRKGAKLLVSGMERHEETV